MSSPRVVVFGSVNLDLVYRVDRLPRAGETVLGTELRRFAGGKGGNQADAAARTAPEGVDVALVACVGEDEAGRTLRDELAAVGVDVAAVRRIAGVSGTALIAVDAAGENTIAVIPGANADWPDELVDAIELGPRDVVVCQLEIPLEVVQRVVARAAAAGARVVLNAAPADPRVAPLLGAVDVVVLNETEATTILGLETIDDDGMAAARAGLRGDLVVTLGGDGAAVADGAGVRRIAPFRVDPVDTVGAGDAFVGAFAAALAGGSTLAEAALRGNAAGATTASETGARVPGLSRGRIDALVASATRSTPVDAD